MKAIVLAAGEGAHISGEQKVMAELLKKPLLARVLENIGFIPQKDTAVVVGYKKESVIAKIGGDYIYAVQDKLEGTAAAVECAKDYIGTEGDVLVCYGDMPLISRSTYQGLIAAHKNADCTVLTAHAPNSSLRYGRIIREGGKIKGIAEHSDCTKEQLKIDELNAGVYVFKAKLLFEMTDKLKESGKPFRLTDVPRMMLEEGYEVQAYLIHNSNEIYGVNTSEDLALCEEILKRAEISDAAKRHKWFGTGGWRAIIGDEFTKENIRIIAQAISDDMKSKSLKSIVVGYDRRFLSDKAAVWCAEVFAGNGIHVYFISRIAPTPLVMFTVKSIGTPYGIAVTASHNPADYNGVKVFTEGGRDAAAEVTDVFEKTINQGVTPVSTEFEKGMRDGIIHVIDPNNEYIDSIINMIDMNAIRNGNLRILLDPMFGVSKTTLQTVLMTARCDVDIINDRHDTLFGGRLPSPTASTLSKLRDMVTEQGYDLGIGTDGDADRIGIIDNEGRFVHPNEILSLLYDYLLRYKNRRGDVVRNVATTHVLDKIAEDFSQKCHEVPVGFKHISSKMEETEALIGGESSGGLTIRGHIKGKDGIFASSLIVEMLCVTRKTIPELLRGIEERYGKTFMEEYDTKFSAEKKSDMQKLLFEDKLLPEFDVPVEKISYMDGCKVYFKNGGWIIARFSGTEPLIRIFCERETVEAAKQCVLTLRTFLGL